MNIRDWQVNILNVHKPTIIDNINYEYIIMTPINKKKDNKK